MFRFISLLALVAPLVSALTINPPAGVIAGGTIDFTWITAPGDPPNCYFYLVNQEFNIFYTISEYVELSLGFVSLQCPPPPTVPPGGGYNIVANYKGNPFAESAAFSIAANTSYTSTAKSSASTSTAAASATPSSNSSPIFSTTIPRKLTEAIIGGIIGGLVLISLV